MFKKKAEPIYTTKAREENLLSESSEDFSDLLEDDHLDEEEPEEQEKRQMMEDKFWNEIEKIRWLDSSDRFMNIDTTRSNLKSRLKDDEFEAFKNRLRKNMDDLYKIMKKHGYENADNEFLSHVVGKGKLFFYNVLDDPEFAIYLFAGEAQDLWSVVSS